MNLEEALALVRKSAGTIAVAVRGNSTVLIGSSKSCGSYENVQMKTDGSIR